VKAKKKQYPKRGGKFTDIPVLFTFLEETPLESKHGIWLYPTSLNP